MWVKGSGGDLRTATRANFASFYLDKLLALQALYDQADTRGAKTEIEDAMVAMYPHAVYGLNPTTGSIDTPLHGFIAARHIDPRPGLLQPATARTIQSQQLIGRSGWCSCSRDTPAAPSWHRNAVIRSELCGEL